MPAPSALLRQPVRRIIVIATRQLGDVLLTTPLIRQAKRLWPQAEVDVLGFAGTLKMLQGNPDVHALIEVPAGSGWRQSWPLIKRLWRRYDLGLIAQHTDRAHLYGLIAARVRSGQVPAEADKSWWKRATLHHAVVLDDPAAHVLTQKMELLAPWAPLSSPQVVPPPPQPLPADLAERLSGRYIVVQPPSLVRYKQWPLEHYAELARSLADRGFQVVLTGGPSDADRALTARVAEQAGGVQVLDAGGQLELPQLTTLLAGAAAYVGPDTSVTHLAAGCGTPVVALYGPIDPRLWGPWPLRWSGPQPYAARADQQVRGNVTLLQGSPACVPCNRQGCDDRMDSLSQCLQTMAPSRVLQAVLQAIEAPT